MPKNKDLGQRWSDTIETRWAENARVTQLLKDKLSQSLDNVSMIGNKLKTIKITIPAKHYYYNVSHIQPRKDHEADEYVLFDDKEQIMSCTDDTFVDKFSTYILNNINKELEMNSIYEQMNKIDDNESLNEKYNVKNQHELKRLKEYWQSSLDRSRERIAEGIYDFVLKHLHPETYAFVADTYRITVDKQHSDLVVVLKMINDASFIARVERMNKTGSNSNSIDFCEPYTVEISKQQPHCKELYTVTDKLCADYSNAVKLIQQNELVLVGKGRSAVWTRFSTDDSSEVD